MVWSLVVLLVHIYEKESEKDNPVLEHWYLCRHKFNANEDEWSVGLVYNQTGTQLLNLHDWGIVSWPVWLVGFVKKFRTLDWSSVATKLTEGISFLRVAVVWSVFIFSLWTIYIYIYRSVSVCMRVWMLRTKMLLIQVTNRNYFSAVFVFKVAVWLVFLHGCFHEFIIHLFVRRWSWTLGTLL